MKLWLHWQQQFLSSLVKKILGGELALLLGSKYLQIKSVIAIAPISVLFPGSPQGFFDVLIGQHAAWSYEGKLLSFVPWPISLQNAPSLVTMRQRSLFEQALSNDQDVRSAAIPVENAKGPILCISAAQDEISPSTLMCDQIVDKLDQTGFPYHYEHISHENTHGWCDLEACWGKVISFLNENFRSFAE